MKGIWLVAESFALTFRGADDKKNSCLGPPSDLCIAPVAAFYQRSKN